MPRISASPSGNDRDREQQRLARRKLAQMNRTEEFAQQYDTFEQLYGDQMPSWQVPAMREHYANTYQKLVGVHPQRRAELRRRLEPVANEGTGDVEQIIQQVKRLVYENTSSAEGPDNPFS